MAEEQFDPHFTQAHLVEAGSFNLDLYRLVCMVLADRAVANHALNSLSITTLQDTYLRVEVTRILISCAAGLCIKFDQLPKRAFANTKTDCGKLYPDWQAQKMKVEVLTLREACNKIIHATDIRFDEVIPGTASRNPDREGVYLRPHLYLYGTRDRRAWRVKLSMIDFAKYGAALFLR